LDRFELGFPMLIAYIDGSHNDDAEIVAGIVVTEQSWAGFDDALARDSRSL
jgi:hypothetical protein